LSLVSTQVSRYRNGDQYGIAQKRALAALDGKRLFKRDEEVSDVDGKLPENAY